MKDEPQPVVNAGGPPSHDLGKVSRFRLFILHPSSFILSCAVPQTVIKPARGWQLINVRELWHFRELIYFLIWRDVKIRYKQTVLGAAWAILQPAMMMVVMTIFFAHTAQVSAE